MVGSASTRRAHPRHARARSAWLGVVLAITSLPAIATPAVATATSQPQILFEGGGYGHGVGLSQYGAKGQALEGRSASAIVTHYYAGTEVTPMADLPISDELADQPLWVGLDQGLSTASFAWSGAGGTVCIDPDPSNEEAPCAKTATVKAGQHFTMTWNPETEVCTLVRTVDGDDRPLKKEAPDCRLSLERDDGAVMWFQGRGYPAGTIELRRAPETDTFHVVAALDLETYTAGIAEVPDSWPATAVEAQALAARSFALNRYLAYEKPDLRTPGDTGLSDTAKANCWCHVYDDTRSQVYGGIEAQTPGRTAAATATAGQVIGYFGDDWASYTRSHVIEAYYSSSNAGVSISNVTAWGSTKQYPYLVSVDDPWSVAPETGNPYATWTHTRTPEELATKLGWDSVGGAYLIGDTSAAVVHFVGWLDGESVTTDLTGDQLRSLLGLLSSQISGVQMTGAATCLGLFATIEGTNGNDRLVGTAGPDVIVGRGGNDTISGKAGDDVLCGSGGGDLINGGNGNDHIVGGAGLDTLYGGGGADTIRGGMGADLIDGGNGSDLLHGERGRDTVIGSNGADVLTGGAGPDVLDGGVGRDSLHGNTGRDSLAGGDLDDALYGGDGPDTLDGGAGDADECTGGEGTDIAAATCELVGSVP